MTRSLPSACLRVVKDASGAPVRLYQVAALAVEGPEPRRRGCNSRERLLASLLVAGLLGFAVCGVLAAIAPGRLADLAGWLARW